jgi:hypothetical protein
MIKRPKWPRENGGRAVFLVLARIWLWNLVQGCLGEFFRTGEKLEVAWGPPF